MRCVINQTLAGQPIINVLHAAKTNSSPWTQAQADTFVNAMRASWVTNVLAKQSKDITLGAIVGTDLTNITGVVATSTAPDAPGGTFAGSLPANAAMCISWPIARHYRGGHPRTYLAGMNQSDVQNANTWTPAAVTSYVSGMVAFRTACNAVSLGTDTVALCVVHRGPKKAPLAIPTIDVLGVPHTDGGIDSQRRRLGKR